jgi:WD40 repeat protein
MDARVAPVNPCSLETIPIPIRLANGRSVWPLMLSCYELSSTSSVVSPLSTDASLESSQQQADSEVSHRVGYMDLSFIEVPDDMARKTRAMPLQFDPHPYVVNEHGGGILDGQWSTLPPYMMNDPTTSSRNSYCFASAHSTGEIQLYAVQVGDEQESDEVELCQISFLGHSTPAKPPSPLQVPLCLSLRWDHPAPYQRTWDPQTSSTTPCRIVSTYSNGTVAIHDVTVSDLRSDEGTVRSAQLIERDRWNAHALFPGAPAEVWTAAFVGSQVVWSGGDDATIKVWDLRATTRPMLTVPDAFEAGVTCIAPHPTQTHMVAVGSCTCRSFWYSHVVLTSHEPSDTSLYNADDENVSLMDTRYMGRTKRPLWKSGKLGGGIWRMKWHPYTANRMLVGAMHAGCCVLDFHDTGLEHPEASSHVSPHGTSSYEEEEDWSVKCTKKFAEHESMVYGSDWLVCPHPTQNGYFEAAARYVNNGTICTL